VANSVPLIQCFLGQLKGMSDERQNWPILSANKIARQKAVVCHAKIAWFCRPILSAKIEHVLSSTILSPNFSYIGQQIFVYVAMVIVYNGRWILSGSLLWKETYVRV